MDSPSAIHQPELIVWQLQCLTLTTTFRGPLETPLRQTPGTGVYCQTWSSFNLSTPLNLFHE